MVEDHTSLGEKINRIVEDMASEKENLRQCICPKPNWFEYYDRLYCLDCAGVKEV